ncbi:MAG: hypothetical protein HRT35_14700 [Algicola sp.]|nr:hypothetical protein [Algicola sp.]
MSKKMGEFSEVCASAERIKMDNMNQLGHPTHRYKIGMQWLSEQHHSYLQLDDDGWAVDFDGAETEFYEEVFDEGHLYRVAEGKFKDYYLAQQLFHLSGHAYVGVYRHKIFSSVWKKDHDTDRFGPTRFPGLFLSTKSDNSDHYIFATLESDKEFEILKVDLIR